MLLSRREMHHLALTASGLSAGGMPSAKAAPVPLINSDFDPLGGEPPQGSTPSIKDFNYQNTVIPLLERAQVDDSLPMLARELFAIQAKDYAQLQTQIDEVDTKLMAWHRADECSRRLAKIPGIGQISAALLTMKTPDPKLFRSGRQFAAWIGLTPKDHSTAGKARLGVITRAGDEGLRSVLVVGATSVILQVRRGRRASPWLAELLKRKAPKLAAVALANKMARIAWKLMFTGETYIAGSAFAPLAGAS